MNILKNNITKGAIGCIGLIGLTACGSADNSSSSSSGAEDNYPSENLDWTVAFGPGGGNDVMSRTMADILQNQDIYPENIVVENLEGGSGARGWSQVKQDEGNPYHMTSTSGNFISTPLVSDTDWNYEDFTPIGLLASDESLFVVDGDSEYDTIEQFVEDAKEENMKIGSVGSAGPGRVVTGLLEENADITTDYVSYQEAGQVTTSLTSDSLDAMISEANEVIGQVESGDLKVLASTGEERSDNETLQDVPTFQEAGYDFTFSLPRGIVMPAGVSEEVQEYWIDAMKQVTETEEFDEYINNNNLTENLVWGEDFGSYLEETSTEFEDTLKETGAIEE